MTITLILPMTAFALAASISPGPVNLVCLSSGTRYPPLQRADVRHRRNPRFYRSFRCHWFGRLCWRLLASLHSTTHGLGYTEPRTGTATRRQLYLPDDWVKIDGIALELQPAIF